MRCQGKLPSLTSSHSEGRGGSKEGREDGGSIKIEAGIMGRVEREWWSRGWMGKKNEKDKELGF